MAMPYTKFFPDEITIDVVFIIDWVQYIQLPAGPWGDSPSTAPLKNSGDFCALS
jgi:hypothetical protein